MANVLAAIDFSGVSDEVIRRAAALARAQEGAVVLLHVAAPDPAFVGYAAGPPSVRDDRARELRGEHEDLQQRARALREAGTECDARLVEGATAETILRVARERDCDPIVMGSHGHGALHDALVGSVSAEVVRAADRPVLLIPARPRSA